MTKVFRPPTSSGYTLWLLTGLSRGVSDYPLRVLFIQHATRVNGQPLTGLRTPREQSALPGSGFTRVSLYINTHQETILFTVRGLVKIV